jgi:hypothetical protein
MACGKKTAALGMLERIKVLDDMSRISFVKIKKQEKNDKDFFSCTKHF